MARRDPCRACGRRTKNPERLCPECRPSTAKRPERPCKGCGKRTTAKSQECLACEPTYMKQGPIGPQHAVWLDAGPGRWVTIRGVAHWVTNTKEKAA